MSAFIRKSITLHAKIFHPERMRSAEEIKTAQLLKRLSSKTGKTIYDHKLISPGDRVLVGLSGGKDSLALLEILHDRWKVAPFSFDIIAAHIIITDSGYDADIQYLSGLCQKMEIELVVEEATAGLDIPSKKAPCFVCSWHRRKKLFELTKKLNCNKLCMGHHRDDALETFVINLMYHGSISSLPYKLKMFGGRIHLIRPILDLWEDEIIEYNVLRRFKTLNNKCQYEDKTKRQMARKLIEKIKEIHSDSKINMFRAMANIFPEYLPGKNMDSETKLN